VSTGVAFLGFLGLFGLFLLFLPEGAAAVNYGLYYALGFTGLFCFAGFVIIGFLHKIFPFLISLKMFEKAKKGAYGKLFSGKTLQYLEYAIFFLFLPGIVSGIISLPCFPCL
jgi:hypothetical protein